MVTDSNLLFNSKVGFDLQKLTGNQAKARALWVGWVACLNNYGSDVSKNDVLR